MDNAVSDVDHEVVDERSVSVEGLCPDAGMPADEIVAPQIRD